MKRLFFIILLLANCRQASAQTNTFWNANIRSNLVLGGNTLTTSNGTLLVNGASITGGGSGAGLSTAEVQQVSLAYALQSGVPTNGVSHVTGLTLTNIGNVLYLQGSLPSTGTTTNEVNGLIAAGTSLNATNWLGWSAASNALLNVFAPISILQWPTSNWNTAHSWGNHALAGYLTSTPWNLNPSNSVLQAGINANTASNALGFVIQPGANITVNGGAVPVTVKLGDTATIAAASSGGSAISNDVTTGMALYQGPFGWTPINCPDIRPEHLTGANGITVNRYFTNAVDLAGWYFINTNGWPFRAQQPGVLSIGFTDENSDQSHIGWAVTNLVATAGQTWTATCWIATSYASASRSFGNYVELVAGEGTNSNLHCYSIYYGNGSVVYMRYRTRASATGGGSGGTGIAGQTIGSATTSWDVGGGSFFGLRLIGDQRSNLWFYMAVPQDGATSHWLYVATKTNQTTAIQCLGVSGLQIGINGGMPYSIKGVQIAQ